MAKVADQYLLVDPWKIIEEGFHADRSEVSESLFSLANEYQGVRGFFDEGYSGDQLIGCYLNSIFEERFVKEPLTYKGISNRLCFMVNTVNWLYTRIDLDGEVLDLAKSDIDGFRRELDFTSGELCREFTWQTRTGKKVKLVFRRLLSMQDKELAIQRVELTPLNFSGPVMVTSGLDFSANHRLFAENFWDCPNTQLGDGLVAILGQTKNIGHKLYAGAALECGPVQYTAVESDKLAGLQFSLSLQEGQMSSLEKKVVLFSPHDLSVTAEAAWQSGQDLLLKMGNQHYQDVLDQNRSYWQDFWQRFDITIDGDPDTQQGIRFCIFQMQQTYRGVVPGANIGAKGLTGEFYNGNAFWDSETYCLPFFLFSNPAAAKSLIEFRYRTLPQAMERARDLDCQGACYPVATIDGTESCTLWQHASTQMQATTAVAYGIQHYVRVTQDVDFLYAEGIELLVQICRYLASRGQWSQKTGKFGYFAVMGPDEFQMMVNNNCYTNYMAKRAFEYTREVLDRVDAVHAERAAGLLARLDCTPAEQETWQRMAEAMYIPFDPQSGLYEESDGFFDLPHIDVDEIAVQDFPLYNHWSYDRIYRNDMIKQPDVLMFLLLYNQSFSRREKLVNYEYYEPRCIHKSSLSPSVHSILASELGKHREAFEFFRFATRIDLDNYNRNSAEGIHTTSIAAAWMNIIYGFGGMRSDGDILTFNPSIPPHWKGYSFQIAYRGALLHMEVGQDKARLRLIEGAPVKVKIGGLEAEVTADGVLVNVCHD